MKTYLNTPRPLAHKLAQAIYDFIDLCGFTEIDEVEDVLAGSTAAEDFIASIEGDIAEEAKPQEEGSE